MRHEGHRRLRPFAQVLVGGAFVDCCGSSGSHWSIEPGGGIDLKPRHSASYVRMGAGFAILLGGTTSPSLFRLQLSATFYADTL